MGHAGPASGHTFDVDTSVRAVGENRFAADVTDRWNALGGGPNGGYSLGICLRALGQVLPFPDPLAVSAHFLRPGVPGSAEVRTETIRAGRRLATGQASLIQAGKEVLRVVADFTDLTTAAGPTAVFAAAPDLPPPDEAVDLTAGGGIPGVTITDRVEYRAAQTPGWVLGKPSGLPQAEFWMRFADGRNADPLSLCFLVDAAAPVVLEIGQRSMTIALSVHVRARPVPGWLACRVATRYLIDGYHEEDFEIWDTTGKLVAQSRQLALIPTRAP
ncbi:MAG: thioesterase family protein [Acidimicrobiia bacterium]|nr:thioesterase family protein [Acidimicrobiia bacterium]